MGWQGTFQKIPTIEAKDIMISLIFSWCKNWKFFASFYVQTVPRGSCTEMPPCICSLHESPVWRELRQTFTSHLLSLLSAYMGTSVPFAQQKLGTHLCDSFHKLYGKENGVYESEIKLCPSRGSRAADCVCTNQSVHLSRDWNTGSCNAFLLELNEEGRG